jgi:putative PIG3 family NAD(P)H quinone oxidoreductase
VRAVTIVDGELRWAEHPDPQAGAGELLVRVWAAGLNGADIAQRLGFYPAPAGAPPDIPGLELAGEVVATGPGVSSFAPGDRVMALVAGGAQAELAVMHERTAMAVPDALSWPEAGGFPEVFTTAHDALFTQCGLGIGERILIHGAAGGVGTAAVQLAVAAGASVVATVRREELRPHVVALGPGAVVVTAPEDFARHGPFDVVLELIGGPNVATDLDALAIGGRIAVIGVGGGAQATLDLLTLMGKRARVGGSTLRSRPLEQRALAVHLVETHVLPLLRRASVRVLVAQTIPMSEAEKAYELFTAGGKLGKIVLVAQPSV